MEMDSYYNYHWQDLHKSDLGIGGGIQSDSSNN